MMAGDARVPGVPGGAPVTVVTGPAGIGRTTLLDRIAAEATDRGAPVVTVRLVPGDEDRDGYLLGRLSAELSRLGGAPGGTPVADDLVVLLDDLQWADLSSLHTLGRMAGELVAGRRVPVPSVVCTLRTPHPGFPAAADVVAALRSSGMLQVLPLRPLSTDQLDALVTRRLGTRPHRELGAWLRLVSAGNPAAALATVDGYRRAGALRVVDVHAYLLGTPARVELPADHPVLRPVRHLPDPVPEVASAVAVLHPLGAAVPGLVGAALGLPTGVVDGALGALLAEGVLRPVAGGGWRFVVPLVAEALRARLGPYQRRRLAQVAVLAAWTGQAHQADRVYQAGRAYLADRLVDAGGFIDPQRAGAELRAAAYAEVSPAGSPGGLAAGSPGRSAPDWGAAERWLAAAADLACVPAVRAAALLDHALVCTLRERQPTATGLAGLLLRGYGRELTRDGAALAQLVYVVGLRSAGELAELERLAVGAGRMPDGAAPVGLARVAALCALDRWGEALSTLEAGSREAGSREAGSREAGSPGVGSPAAGSLEAGEAAAVGLAAALRDAVSTLLGRPTSRLADPSTAPVAGCDGAPLTAAWRTVVATRTRLLLGDVVGAVATLHRHGFAVAALPDADRLVLAWRTGRWAEAIDLAQARVAAGGSVGDPFAVAVPFAVASMRTHQGWPSRARVVLDEARSRLVPLGHLLDLVDAEVDRGLGAVAAAVAKVEAGLAAAGRSEVLAGTDELWLLRAELAVAAGDRAVAARAVAATGGIAARLDTPVSRLAHLVTRVVVEGDAAAAAGAVEVARALDQPFVLARTLEIAARAGCVPVVLLREAYHLYGQLDALPHRARLRGLMRERDVAVPNRGETVAETERLIACLVTEGMSNREMAAALQTSEKSIEGRLTRLFSRTGYRSRVELATAVLTGADLVT